VVIKETATIGSDIPRKGTYNCKGFVGICNAGLLTIFNYLFIFIGLLKFIGMPQLTLPKPLFPWKAASVDTIINTRHFPKLSDQSKFVARYTRWYSSFPSGCSLWFPNVEE
jgi:hypothetical protein